MKGSETEMIFKLCPTTPQKKKKKKNNTLLKSKLLKELP